MSKGTRKHAKLTLAESPPPLPGAPRGFASPGQREYRAAMLEGRSAAPGVVRAGFIPVEKPIAPPAAVQITDEIEQSIVNLARWRLSPLAFVREVLSAVPDLWQVDVLEAVGAFVRGEKGSLDKFCLKACKGPGKTCVEAWIILWFMTCFEHPKILVTSVTEDNLKDNLWAEISTWLNKSPMLMALFQKDSERMYARDHKDTWFCSVRTWPKDADRNKQAATLAGLHGKNTMVLIDESGTVPTAVLSAALAHHSTFDPTGKLPEVHLTFQAGNPDVIDGALGWACTVDSKNWWIKEITGDPDDPKRAPRIDVKWAREQIETWGKDHAFVLVNVFGRFPPVGSNKLLGPDIVRKAMEIWLPDSWWRKHMRVMALDVARSTNRDRSVLARRQGAAFFPFIKYRLDDAIQLAGQVAFEYSRWPCDAIFVDAVGIGGPVADHLKSPPLNLPVIMFHGGLPARERRFYDRRTEVAWHAAQAVKGSNGNPEVALPLDQEFVADATGPNIEFNSKGQMKLESKEKMLSRGVQSPDIFDAYCMTFAEPVGIKVEPSAHVVDTINATRSRGSLAVEYNPYDER